MKKVFSLSLVICIIITLFSNPTYADTSVWTILDTTTPVNAVTGSTSIVYNDKIYLFGGLNISTYSA